MKAQVTTILVSVFALTVTAQNPSSNHRTPTGSDWMRAYKVTKAVVPYCVADPGKEFRVKWGMDTAWDSETNVRRGIAFIGKQQIELARASFTPNYDLTSSGTLSSTQRSLLQSRLNHINLIGKHVEILLNDDPGGDQGQVNDMYKSDPKNWAHLFDKTVEYVQSKGFKVASIAPFNEPDYGWGQGTKTDFLNICKAVRSGDFPRLDTIRLCGGNTLNDDKALEWYNYLKEYLEEGNTHQLAGSFDNYAKFFAQVKADGKVATADELHNIGEAIVGMEYGMEQGIWWGFDGLARGELCRATFGQRLAYAEDRQNWTAAAVFRNTLDGDKIEAFVGTSERQANKSSYLFVSKDRDVFYDGYGPQRTFIMQTPGGSGYQSGQTNAERVINITWGTDVQPSAIDGNYAIMNKSSKLVIAPSGGVTTDGTRLVQVKNTHKDYMEWAIHPIDSAHGGDFSYYTLQHVKSGKQADLWNWNLNSGVEVNLFSGSEGDNELYWFEYAGDGCYFIHNKHSNLVLGVADNNVSSRVSTQAKASTTAAQKRQLWRLIPLDAECELTAPDAPTGLAAKPQSASIHLTWEANTEDDVTGYTILRGVTTTAGDTEWNTIARNISGTEFIDNTCRQGICYSYKICAIDKAVNTSVPSPEVQCTTTTMPQMICQLQFDKDLMDKTVNQFDACCNTSPTYSPASATSTRKSGTNSISLDGSQYIQLPYAMTSADEMTICCWMKLKTGNGNWARLFDFGNGTDQYMFLTPNSGTDARLVMKDGGDEQILSFAKLSGTAWKHVAVTFSHDAVSVFVDGEKVGESTDITIRPSDLNPALCFIGRSQYLSDPMLKAYIDDFRIYNYPLTSEQLLAVMDDTGDVASSIDEVNDDELNQGNEAKASSNANAIYNIFGQRLVKTRPGINIINGKKILIH